MGAGPASLASALPFSGDSRERLVVDIAEQIPDETVALRARLSESVPVRWSAEDRVAIKLQRQAGGALPVKAWLGSDYATYRGNVVVDSQGRELLKCAGAIGGLSRIWGATLARWPDQSLAEFSVSIETLHEHYKCIENLIPSKQRSLPNLAAAMSDSLPGVVYSPAKVAIDRGRCIACNSCMYGCASDAIFTAANWLPKLLSDGFQLRQQLRVVRIREEGGCVIADAIDNQGGELAIIAERAIVGCGAISSCKLMMDSWPERYSAMTLSDSQYFIVPFLGAISDDEPEDSLAHQFVSISQLTETTNEVMFQLYPKSPALTDELEFKLRALPKILRLRLSKTLANRMLIAQGYLHSKDSGVLELRSNLSSRQILSECRRNSDTHKLANRAASKLAQSLRRYGYKNLPLILAPVGAGYHFGRARIAGSSDNLFDQIGRPPGIERIHFVDGAVLPIVAAGPITLTIMANAHRIGEQIRSLCRI